MEQMIAHSGKRVKEENGKTKGSAIEKKAHLYSKMGLLLIIGSPGRTRTADQVVNSHPLYRLSYRGMFFNSDFKPYKV